MTSSRAIDRVLETPRLRLRTVDEADAARVVQLMTRTVSDWLSSWPYPLDEVAAATRLRQLRQLVADGQGLCFAIEARDGAMIGVMIGMVMIVRSPDNARRAGLGYWLGEAHQRQGYMAEAATAAVADAFDRLDVDAIEAGAQPANTASFAIMR